ncbi:MAG: hypothetical protein IH984_16005 [Planctomycetes bacterium]|nr:hypothetical protein [Planctomycetota bacterium]
MQVVAVRKTLTVPIDYGRSQIKLEAGRRYVMHDEEVASGQAAGVWKTVKDLPDRPTGFVGPGNLTGRLIIPFIGEMSSAFALLPVLASIHQYNPDLSIELSSTPGPAELFSLAPQLAYVRPYPLKVEAWSQYDHFITMEVLSKVALQSGLSMPEALAKALGIELGKRSFELKLPDELEKEITHDGSTPLVALSVGEGKSLRAYPAALLRQVVSSLAEQSIACVLLGQRDPNWVIPEAPPFITDLRGRTSSILQMAVWLRAANVIVAHDSLAMYLAGSFGKPTISLFAPTNGVNAKLYGSLISLQSKADCAPCHETTDICPKGFDRCVAWENESVKPQLVIDAVLEQLTEQGIEFGAQKDAGRAFVSTLEINS